MADLALVQYRSTDPRASVDVSVASPLPVTDANNATIATNTGTIATNTTNIDTNITTLVAKSGREIQDTFTRPTDTIPYTINDVIAATTSTTATTPMRSLALARASGKPFILAYASLRTNKTDFLATVRMHLYTVANPAAAPNSGTALVGDNIAMIQTANNIATRIGHFDFLPLALGHAAGDDYVGTVRDDLRIVIVPTDGNVYYRLEIIGGTSITPANAQTFYIAARSVDL